MQKYYQQTYKTHRHSQHWRKDGASYRQTQSTKGRVRILNTVNTSPQRVVKFSKIIIIQYVKTEDSQHQNSHMTDTITLET